MSYRGSDGHVAVNADSSHVVRLDREDCRRSRTVWVEPTLYVVTPQKIEVPTMRFRTADLTATRKHVPICLPRPSAPLQSMTTHVSRLCSLSRDRASGKPRRGHLSQPTAPNPSVRRIAPPASARRQPPAHDGAVACIRSSSTRGSAGRILAICPSPHPPPKRTMSCRDGHFQDETEAPSFLLTTSRVRHCEHNRVTEDSTGPLAR